MAIIDYKPIRHPSLWLTAEYRTELGYIMMRTSDDSLRWTLNNVSHASSDLRLAAILEQERREALSCDMCQGSGFSILREDQEDKNPGYLPCNHNNAT